MQLMALAVVGATTACHLAPEDAANLAAASQPLGSNLLGEACRLERDATKDAEQVFEIYCGGWEQPSARVVRVTNKTAALESLASSGEWRLRLDGHARCDLPHQATVLGEVPALILNCVIRQGGWPYQGMVLRLGEEVWLGDGIPASAPLMEKAVARLTGRQAPTSSSSETRLRDKTISRLFSAGDLAGYRQLLHRAQYHNHVGEFPEAEKLYRRALSLQQDRLTTSAGGHAFLFMSLALELSNQERFAQADAAFAQAEAALPDSFDDSDEPRLISYQAIHFANQKRGQKASELAQAATDKRLELLGKLGAPSGAGPHVATGELAVGSATRLKSAMTLAGRGETARGDIVQSEYIRAAMLVRQAQFDEAEAALGRAAAVLDEEPRVPRRWLPQIEFLRAAIAEKRGDPAAAQLLLERSIAGYRALGVDSRNEALAWLALGRVQKAMGQGAVALLSFRRAIAMLRDRKVGIVADDAMAFFQAAMDEAMRDPEARQRLFTEMFGASQLIRSTRTTQSIALASARLSANDKAVGALIRDLQNARQKRDEASEAMARSYADPTILAPQVQLLEQRWRLLAASAADLERQVQAAAPRYQQLLDAPAPVDAASGVLGTGEALLQVVPGTSRTVVFFVDDEGIEAYAADVSERDLERDVRLLRAPFDQVAGASFDTAKAHELYKKLLGPVAPRLARAQHVIVVLSGPLLALPFGVLISEPPPRVVDGDYSRISWIARRQAVTLAPSVQAFVTLRQSVRPSRATRPMIGFGGFEPERDVQGTLQSLGLPEACSPEIHAISELPRLPASEGELQAVRQALRSTAEDIHLGRNFSQAAVKKAQLDDYRVVYFATHAMLPHDFRCWAEPMLIASAGPGEDDGLLLASEIAELTLDADLVVLSACNTAAAGGSSGAAESLSGLARAFFYAGARSLLVTHWRIPDEPTRRLMSRLFRDMSAENLTTAEALRRAQSFLIEDARLSHPINWGAFSLVGDGGQRLQGAPSAVAAGDALR